MAVFGLFVENMGDVAKKQPKNVHFAEKLTMYARVRDRHIVQWIL